MRGPPTIRPAREVTHADVGQSVSLVCEATAVPRIKGFQWSFQGRELGVPSQKTNISIVESQQGNVIRSTLIIAKLGENNFGDYRCRVSNQMSRTQFFEVFLPKMVIIKKCACQKPAQIYVRHLSWPLIYIC